MMPLEKRVFDLIVGTAMTVFLLPLLVCVALAIMLLEGRPVFYISRRRCGPGPAEAIAKFRTMRRDADRIANRDTVPITTQRFLNLPIESPLYTPIGRLIERFMLTEMPQLAAVLSGRMSLIGNRPLPDNVVAALREDFPDVEDRFSTPAGLTGPVQLIGRDAISDADRIEIELAYCHVVRTAYSPLLDLSILWLTVLGGIVERKRMTPQQVLALLGRHGGRARASRAAAGAALVQAAPALSADSGASAFGRGVRRS